MAECEQITDFGEDVFSIDSQLGTWIVHDLNKDVVDD